jgi:hypothetical protein
MMTIFGDEARTIVLINQVIEIVTGLEDYISSSPAVAATRTTLRPVSFADERHGALPPVPGTCVDFYLVNKHPVEN